MNRIQQERSTAVRCTALVGASGDWQHCREATSRRKTKGWTTSPQGAFCPKHSAMARGWV